MRGITVPHYRTEFLFFNILKPLGPKRVLQLHIKNLQQIMSPQVHENGPN